jgi:hypothetical protein
VRSVHCLTLSIVATQMSYRRDQRLKVATQSGRRLISFDPISGLERSGVHSQRKPTNSPQTYVTGC